MSLAVSNWSDRFAVSSKKSCMSFGADPGAADPGAAFGADFCPDRHSTFSLSTNPV